MIPLDAHFEKAGRLLGLMLISPNRRPIGNVDLSYEQETEAFKFRFRDASTPIVLSATYHVSVREIDTLIAPLESLAKKIWRSWEKEDGRW